VQRCKCMRRTVWLLNELPCCQQCPALPHNFPVNLKPIQLFCTHLHRNTNDPADTALQDAYWIHLAVLLLNFASPY
jgi:hypothetical protein